MAKTKKRLNIGCGKDIKEGFVKKDTQFLIKFLIILVGCFLLILSLLGLIISAMLSFSGISYTIINMFCGIGIIGGMALFIWGINK